MKLSLMTYTMARQGFGVKDFIKTARACKVDGIDWVTTYGYKPEDLKMMSHDAGLEIACHTFLANKFLAGEENWLDEIKQSLEDAVLIGSKIVMIPTYSNPAMGRDMFRKSWIAALKQISLLADDAGVILTVENFPGKHSAFITAADYYEAKAEVPSLKLTYDNGNAAGGEDPIESFKRSAPDVVHAHFKDWYISEKHQDDAWELLDGKYYTPALISQGDIDTPSVWNTMREYGYDGFINIEYEGNAIKADEATRIAVEYLRSL
jgi:sugar phosphate isomerase/epimerase